MKEFNIENFEFYKCGFGKTKYYFLYKEDKEYCIEGEIIIGKQLRGNDTLPYVNHIEMEENGYEIEITEEEQEQIEEILDKKIEDILNSKELK